MNSPQDQPDTTIMFYSRDNLGKIPERMSPGAAGYDLFSSESSIIPAHTRKLVSTNIHMVIPEGFYAQIAPRSSLAIREIDVGAGVIDSDYRGEVKVLLVNNSNQPFAITQNDRIAQLLLKRIHNRGQILVVDKDAFAKHSTERMDGGFGSTGK